MLNAYQKAGSDNNEKKNEGKSPLVHKPVFEKINSRVGEIIDNEAAEKENLRQAQIAAKTGVWYSKEKKTVSSDDVKAATKALTSGGLIKVPEQPKEAGEKESIYRRVAKFLVIIGVDEAAKILPRLGENQIDKIIPEIASIHSVSKEESEEILAEFQGLLDRAREAGGVDTARTILTKAYGSEKAENIIEKSVPNAKGKPFDFLQEADSHRLMSLLMGESEQVQALVLSQVQPKKAADVIRMMDEKTKTAIVLRLAKMQNVAPQVMESVSKALHEKMLTQNTDNSQNMNGKNVLAQILKRMDPGTETAIISSLSDDDPELGSDIRKMLFTEEDFIACDNRYLQNKLHDMDDKAIAVLIKGKTPEFREKILSNLSSRRSSAVLDEESLIQYLLKSDSEKATSQFFADLRRAWEDGELFVNGRDDGEVYV